MNNQDIRNAIGGNGLKHWQVAEALGVSESLLSRKLRSELPDDEKNKILEIVKQLAKGESK